MGSKKQWAIAVIIGLTFFGLLKYNIEPWVIETLCQNMVDCK